MPALADVGNCYLREGTLKRTVRRRSKSRVVVVFLQDPCCDAIKR
jgi:hypothetical protein